QHPPRSAAVAVRTTADPMRIAPAVASAVKAIEPRVALTNTMTMDQYLARYRSPLRWFALVLGVLAAAVLVLSSSGLYGVMSYNVARRTREIGIRMALGARDRTVLRMILARSVRLTWTGTVLGIIAVGGVARLLQLLFLGVEPWDPWLFLGIAGLLGAVALVASYRPARRAALVDPQISLRAE
ncbi:MAG TPA: FtsX-like permease family protein, partial [Longimicrobiaceae bacterium]|nr:FtsX-like permease family protein [Longimicrobiaceae bacterium]